MRHWLRVGAATVAIASLSVSCGGDDDDDDDVVVMPDAATGTPDAATGIPDAADDTPDGAVVDGGGAVDGGAVDGGAVDGGAVDGSAPDAMTSECTPFGADTCGAGEWCKPTTFDMGVWNGACVPEGAGAEGATCAADADCGAGLVCGVPDPIHGGASCEPVCDPAATGGDPGVCSGGSDSCTGATGEDYGFCVEACTPFDATDSCTGGQFCFPGSFDTGTTTWSGSCVTPGGTGIGDACTVAGECVTDSLCSGKPFPAGESDGFHCFTLCDPAAGCSGTDVCAVLGDGVGGALDFGACIPTCTPFETGTAAGCAADEWCMPDLLDASIGYCAPTGTTADGDACTMISECVATDWCIGDECSEICEVAATTAPGTCDTAGDVCLPLSDGTDLLPVGTCFEGCTFPGGGCSGGATCMMGELFDAPDDFCLDGVTTVASGGDCLAVGLDEGDLCGSNGLCLDDDGSGPGTTVSCYDICRASVGGGIGASPHPDCRDGSLTCIASADPDFGICL